ncbi:S8 family serine peptidase [bacterium]|nr:S8 family serine peptidase [bacterium]
MRRCIVLVFTIFMTLENLSAQKSEDRFWYHQSVAENKKAAGIASEQAYRFVANRTPKTVIVAVIDGGIDTTHEDLKPILWVNEDEIPGNGLDDDNNGFVDDIHGWNFLGGDSGSVDVAQYELVRIVRDYGALVKLGQASPEQKTVYTRAKKEFEEMKEEATGEFEGVNRFATIYRIADSLAMVDLGEGYTRAQLKKWKTTDERTKASKNFLLNVVREDFNKKEMFEYIERVQNKVEYQLNTEFDPRTMVGDRERDWSDSIYGNNDVMGPRPDHGTHVSGIVGALRGNDKGGDGIASNVRIMTLRAVPDGDEYDKDVANAILYAARNGAQVINMSFGKYYSMDSEMVARAIRIAESKGVIMVHAAGNDAKNIDFAEHYPVYPEPRESPYWIEVGAHTTSLNKNYPAPFSNYGLQSVDFFAPGYDIYAPVPGGNTYDFYSGTSMAAPVVTGAVAFLLSYFPELKPSEIKALLSETSNDYSKLKVLEPHEGEGKPKKVRFDTLSPGGKSINLERAAQSALGR